MSSKSLKKVYKKIDDIMDELAWLSLDEEDPDIKREMNDVIQYLEGIFESTELYKP